MQGLMLLLAALVRGEPEKLVFNRDVRPILSAHCFPCHGPDSEAREADLRLDQASVLEDVRRILVPGDPEQSELHYRITADSEAERMPPDFFHKPLDEGQRALLTRWIEEGASYETHWSFRPIRKPPLPEVEDPHWARGPLDRFVQARWEEAGLEPNPEADRRTLLRRVTFDLTGLPPTPAEIQAFLADDRPDAYERVVDRLLASVDHAERMTLQWMDAARYGDTSVMHADGPRTMWPWRDWVIDAYRRNMPFDRFLTWQLAGDLVPDATRESRVATGFLRNNASTDEGGAIDEEFRVEYAVDRVKTVGNVFLGLSTECAQCHEHKYDPISQTDYYRLFAYFNQSRERGMQTRQGNEPPLVSVPSLEQERRRDELVTRIQELEAELSRTVPDLLDLAAWMQDARDELLALEEPAFGAWQALGPFRAGSQGEAFRTAHGPEKEGGLGAPVGELQWTERRDWPDGQVHDLRLPANSALYLWRTLTVERAQQRRLSLGTDDTIQAWLNGKELIAKEVGRGAAPDQDFVDLDLHPGENHFLLKVCNGGGASGFYFRLLGTALPDPVAEALRQEPGRRTEEQVRLVKDHYVRSVWPEGQVWVQAQQELDQRRAQLEGAIPTVMVMEDLPDGRMTYVLDRGQYAAPRQDQPVEPGVLEFLLPAPKDAPKNRLGLARWLVDPEHPLTARVAVNRYWAMLFGAGLVTTVTDFGSQGEWPTHPGLLDWLARDFLDSGFDVRRMLRQIVTSATYRQSSVRTPQQQVQDPANRLLGRGSRHRLPGEFLRDQALSVAGLLVRRPGGPGVKPYQPPGLWNEVALDKNLRFTQDHGEALYRKSMYIYWKRSAPMPAMTAFDTPTREKCVVQRQRTNTPLQALVTLNDVQFVEAARHLAERLLTEGGAGFETRLDLGFELCTGQPADALRRDVMREVLAEQRAAYQADPAAARALLSAGESPRNESLDPVEHAAWTILASMLLNLDETLTRG